MRDKVRANTSALDVPDRKTLETRYCREVNFSGLVSADGSMTMVVVIGDGFHLRTEFSLTIFQFNNNLRPTQDVSEEIPDLCCHSDSKY